MRSERFLGQFRSYKSHFSRFEQRARTKDKIKRMYMTTFNTSARSWRVWEGCSGSKRGGERVGEDLRDIAEDCETAENFPRQSRFLRYLHECIRVSGRCMGLHVDEQVT